MEINNIYQFMPSNSKSDLLKYKEEYLEKNTKLKKWVDENSVDLERLAEYTANKKISDKLLALKFKILGGKKLSKQELEFLRKNSRDTYELAKEVERERKAYIKSLKNCKTKKEAENLKLNKDISYANKVSEAVKQSTSKVSDQEKEEICLKSIQTAHSIFLKTKNYKDLPVDIKKFKTNDEEKKKTKS